MSRYTAGRVPFEVIEIDQDFCDHEFGVAPCTAVLTVGGHKCFNTISTCSDIPNYQRGALTLRFCKDMQDIPRNGNRYFPYLTNVTVRPAHINPGGANNNSSPLGKRAVIQASFSDHPWSDRYVDKYQAERITGVAQEDGIGYDPAARSTFWRKWKARNLYYLHRPMRYISGYIENGQIVDAVTRHFVITGFSGPDQNGNVSIEGKDILILAQREKAQAPVASPGKLLGDINDTDTSFTLDPAGVGDAEYPASGVARLGGELVDFTRTGDAVTITRAQYNTQAESHSAGDTFQLCLVIESKRADEILYILLSDYAGIDDAFLDTDQWYEEAVTNQHLPRLYSTIIAAPEDVEKLLGEICQQMFFYIWFDERENLVKMRAVRPADGEAVTSLDDGRNIIGNSLRTKDQTDQLITRVVVNYGVRNYAEGLEESSNYRVTDIFADPEEEGDNRNRTRKTLTINSRWIRAVDGAAALDLGEKLLARYRVPPRRIDFAMDAKDRDLWVGAFCSINSPKLVNAVGKQVPINTQVLSAEEARAGSRFSYSCQQFLFELPAAPNEKPLDIPSDVQNLNLRSLYDSAYGVPPEDGDIIRVTIRAGAVVGSDSTAEPALIDGEWPSGVQIIIVNDGHIVGAGGDGGSGAVVFASGGSSADDGFPGQVGGPAIETTTPMTIDNRGTIAGGAGGGGGGGAVVFSSGGWATALGGGGGGGAGRLPGDGFGDLDGIEGEAGTLLAGGEGGDGGVGPDGGGAGTRRVGKGGTGGGLGLAGDDGEDDPGGSEFVGGAGGNPGPAIDGITYITWELKGDVRGPEV